MPSAALRKFETDLLVDVQRIVESHNALNHEGGGRRGLGHITRSGVLMLCAAWELYLEELITEGAGCLAQRAGGPKDLPLPVQKEVARAVRDSKHHLRPLDLAGDGWRTVYSNHVSSTVAALNTPKSATIDPTFKRLCGVEDLSACWSIGTRAIDDFVTARGDIAHRGRAAQYVRIGKLEEYQRHVTWTVVETDNAMADFVRANSDGGTPWNRRTC